jgi:hypothetical protein
VGEALESRRSQAGRIRLEAVIAREVVVTHQEGDEASTSPIALGEIGGVSTVPDRDAVVESADPLCGLGQQFEILRRQRLRSVGASQLLESLAPRVTLECLATGGKLVLPAVPHWLLFG